MKGKNRPFEVFVKTATSPMPHYALGVEEGADVALWKPFKCILTRTVPPRYTGGWRTRMRNQYAKELQELADKLNNLTAEKPAVLLATLAKERAIQECVAGMLPKRAVKPPSSFRADFGRRDIGERQGSHGNGGDVDPLW